jgi:hypothetical protein
MPIANFGNKRLRFSNIRKLHTSKVLITLNLFSSYCYLSYSQKEYSKFFICNRFGVWNERWQMRTTKTNDSAPQKFIKFTWEQCSYFLIKCGPIDMVLIPSMSKPIFPFEIDLKYRMHKSRCDLEMNVTALETVEIVTRVVY